MVQAIAQAHHDTPANADSEYSRPLRTPFLWPHEELSNEHFHSHGESNTTPVPNLRAHILDVHLFL